MGLASALSTALTGLSAAETTIDVVGNNLANSNTVGFKSSTASFATQFLQTKSLGSQPTTGSGGTNPRQVGLGTLVAEITPDFSQGTIEVSSNPSDLAIQGDGFFMVEGSQGEQLYTRNGIFKTNAQNELVNINGNRLLGYGVDDRFQIQSTVLVPIDVPLGSAAVAQPTENVYLEGTLSPTGDLSTAAEVIRTDTLSDSNWTAPPAGTGIASLAPPNLVGPPATTHVGQVAGNALVPGDTYHYKIVYANGALGSTTGTEGIPSTVIDLAGVSLRSIAGGDAVDEDTVYIDDIPPAPPGTFTHFRIYRSTDGGTSYNYAGEDVVAATNFTDDGGTTGAALDETRMTGNYSYYITFADSPGGPGFGTESRPAPLIGPLPVSNGRVTLDDLPVDASGQYTVRRIYRNLSNDDASFHFVGEILDSTTPNLNWTDKATDAAISGNAEIDLDGPRATSSTLLTELLRRDGAVYENVFTDTGSLEFTGRKGGRALQTKSLTVDNTTTVLDMLNFMEEAMGIRRIPGPDPLNPIPPSVAGAGDNPGGSIIDGRIQLVGNNGVDNSLEIGLSGLQLYTATGQENINLPFGSSQAAVGESAVTDFLAYDSLGIPLQVRLTTILESRDSTSTTYRWFADSPDNDPQAGVDIAVGTGLLTFDGEGNFLAATEDTVSIDRRNVSSASPLEFDLDFSQLSGLATETSSLAVSRQDGSSPGVLTSFIIGEDGRIRGVFSNGMTRDLAQIRLARFSNPAGLEQRGQNLFATGVNSGLPIQGNPGEQGIGDIIAGALELSNTDIGGNLIDLILASTMYRGNTRVITTAQQMFDELLALRR